MEIQTIGGIAIELTAATTPKAYHKDMKYFEHLENIDVEEVMAE